jgi:hypothetical protein
VSSEAGEGDRLGIIDTIETNQVSAKLALCIFAINQHEFD